MCFTISGVYYSTAKSAQDIIPHRDAAAAADDSYDDDAGGDDDDNDASFAYDAAREQRYR